MSETDQGPVGAERVLTVLMELAKVPEGLSLDELTKRVEAAKPTVHRALASLTRVGLANRLERGRYVLGDEFLRLAFLHQDRRLDSARMEPLLDALTAEFGETTHYAVLDKDEVVYRAKRDPTEGAVRLTSTVGGRNPAYRTGVGKVLLAWSLDAPGAAAAWARAHELRPRTEMTITDPALFVRTLEEVRTQGYAVDDQENELGVNCIALPVFLDSPLVPSGALSVSALSFRTPLPELVARLERIRSIADAHDVRTRLQTTGS
ncbi:IclR family transcriptional regulator [Microbacterium sp. SSW1-49]|uniref:IclR family transcriptional regulator n=1 Tax=Microbacterium croceum TaxID=2851645 RepID=A0ABT0FBM9_9MICO|nr:IclR family transcriptional regulator [Microbacterium croceum]MCK2035467.1 IclR family transcriptional regulator [Microbacterium croceum]